MIHNCEGQSHKALSTNHDLLKRKENSSGIEPKSLCLPTYRLAAGPNGLIGEVQCCLSSYNSALNKLTNNSNNT